MTPIPITIVGSTGSIGRSTLAVVDRYPDHLRVVGLAAHANAALLAEQVARYRPEIVGLGEAKGEDTLRSALGRYAGRIVIGERAMTEVAGWKSAATTVIAVVGFAGVRPTLAAIAAGHAIALANKETLVTAGELVMAAARTHGVEIVPIDSEHSAVWQCLRAGRRDEVRRIILTASGGPFRDRPVGTFGTITPDDALAHPTWKMGPRITIDSATMMNKGFEIIEAARLFGLRSDQIDVVIHPQSIVHSMVEFQDGSTIAQLGATDMTLPIAYALFAPERPPAAEGMPRLDVASLSQLDFATPDPQRFGALALARRALDTGGTAPAVLNAADETAVAAFLAKRIPFKDITELVSAVLSEPPVVSGSRLEDIEQADRWARTYVNQRLTETYTDSGEAVSPQGQARA